MKITVCAVAMAFAIMRFTLDSHPVSKAGSYEAFAHLFVGGLIGAGNKTDRKWCWLLAGALSAVEVVAFVIR